MFIEYKFPEMKRLRKRQTSNMMFGRGYKFFNPKNNDVLFHVVSGGPVYLKKNGGTEPKYPGVRLYVDSKLYDEMEGYLGNFENSLLEWFNETYNQNTDNVIRGIR